jgi:hypothetical protein
MSLLPRRIDLGGVYQLPERELYNEGLPLSSMIGFRRHYAVEG